MRGFILRRSPVDNHENSRADTSPFLPAIRGRIPPLPGIDGFLSGGVLIGKTVWDENAGFLFRSEGSSGMRATPWHSRKEESKEMCRRWVHGGARPIVGGPAPAAQRGAPWPRLWQSPKPYRF